MQVEDWANVTTDFLELTWERMQRQEFDLAKAFFPYWLDALLYAPIGEREEKRGEKGEGPWGRYVKK